MKSNRRDRTTSPRPDVGQRCEQARTEIARLSQALHDRPLDGPGEHYLALGYLQLMLASLQRSAEQLAAGMRAYQDQDGLRAENGPFAGDPQAALDVAMTALMGTRREFRALLDSLERAQIATAELGLAQDQPTPTRRGWPRRRAPGR